MNHSKTRSLAVCAALLLIVPALAGCSLEIVNSGDSAPEASGGAPETSQGAEADGDEPSSESGLDRGAYDAMVSQTISCESGSVDIDAAGAVVKVEGSCAQLEVSAAGAVVLSGSVDSLTVSGTGNTVFVDTAESVEMAGTGNTVVWAEGTPDVSDSGVSNTAVSSQG